MLLSWFICHEKKMMRADVGKKPSGLAEILMGRLRRLGWYLLLHVKNKFQLPESNSSNSGTKKRVSFHFLFSFVHIDLQNATLIFNI